jgi:GrpB-like predicted nucleotidyltransferase (UPF0157 family)
MLGLERGTVRIEPHQREWSVLFDSEAARLRSVLDDRVLAIEHVGSTAVEGLAAKPVLDILVLVADEADAKACVEPLEELGYEHRDDDPVPDRYFMAKGPSYGRTHYCSITPRGSDTHHDQVDFRDHLRSHPEVAREYEQLKRDLASEHPDNRRAYTAKKARFIRNVLENARS